MAYNYILCKVDHPIAALRIIEEVVGVHSTRRQSRDDMIGVVIDYPRAFTYLQVSLTSAMIEVSEKQFAQALLGRDTIL